MRLTCLKCGNQFELVAAHADIRLTCTCGKEYTYPEVVNTGIRPNERAAERSRSRAFRAAGLVKNVGGFALGLTVLGVLFFPLALVGASLGLYVVTMLRGPVGRYSGRRPALAAVAIGTIVFAVELGASLSWVQTRRAERIRGMQQGASEDLRALLRAERLYRAGTDTYGTFDELRFTPQHGRYTFYLGPDDVLAPTRKPRAPSPLPPDLQPSVSENAFLAVAVGNVDDDPDLDVWTLDDTGRIEHVHDDALEEP